MLSRCCLSKMFSRYSLSKMFSHYSLSKYFHVAGSHCPGFIVSFYPGVLHTRVQRPSLSLILHFQLTCYVLPTYNSHLLTKFSFQDWMDYQLHWNVTEYGGVESIRIHPKLIWTPDLLMYNRWVLRCCKMQICICFVFEYKVVWGGGLNKAICSCGVC